MAISRLLRSLSDEMDWLRETPFIDEYDTTVFRFEPAPCKVLLISPTEEVRGLITTIPHILAADSVLQDGQVSWDLTSDEDWSNWFENVRSLLLKRSNQVNFEQEYQKKSSDWHDGLCIMKVHNSYVYAVF